jgi:hypothetical protein
MIALSRIKDLVGGADGSSAPRISVFGDSHTVALRRAQQYSRSHRYEQVRVNRIRKEKGGKLVGDSSLADFCREIRGFAPDDMVCSAVGGNQYAIVSTVRSPVDYDFLTSSDDALHHGAQLVPHRALQGFVESGIRETIGPVLQEIRKSTSACVFHLVPPPPKQDNQFIAAHAEGYFADVGLQDFGPTRPELRLKCWNVQLQSLAALCGELGIGLIMPPPKSVTAEGYLSPDYYAKDVTHANRRYGAAVIEQILQLAEQGRKAKRS